MNAPLTPRKDAPAADDIDALASADQPVTRTITREGVTTPPRTALVLGAQGRFGACAVQAFRAAGWRVVEHARRAGAVNLPLADLEGLAAAARGAQVVVYAVNPRYTRWSHEMLPLARHGMALAERLDALFMLPGNVYAYGEGMPVRIDETTPEAPTTEKGRLRQQLEAEMAERASSRGLRSVVIRAGDFFGGPGRGSWLDLIIAKQLKRARLVYPGPMDVPHAWAYLPDLAQAFERVASRNAADARAGHRRLHFSGHTLTGTQLLDGLALAATELGLPAPTRRRMNWHTWRMLGVVVPLLREVVHMAYLWRVPHGLAGHALDAFVGPLAVTPLPSALRQSLLDLGMARPA